MGKASRDQLETMAALGVFRGEDVTATEAVGVIEEAMARGLQADYQRRKSAAPRIAEIFRHRAALSLRMKHHAVQKLKNAKEHDYMPSIIINLEKDLARWTADLDQFKTRGKKDREDYLKFWQARLSDDPEFEQLGYSRHLKKPSLEQLDKVLRKLDAQNPDWENSTDTGGFVHEEEYVFQALIKKYPKLRQENGKSSHLAEVYESAVKVNLAEGPGSEQTDQRNAHIASRMMRKTPLAIACCVSMIIIYAIINRGDELDAVKTASAESSGVLNPLTSVDLERLVWSNADETETMEVRFKLTNKTEHPVTDIRVRFEFFELEGARLNDAKTITLNDVIKPGEGKQYVKFSLGSYPQDAIRVTGRVLSLSKAQDQ